MQNKEADDVLASNDIDWIYTPLEEAKRELDRRRKDLGLIKKVKEFSASLSFSYLEKPKAVLSRPIATPNFEFREFIRKSSLIGLETLVLEYPSKLVMRNKDKYYACNLNFSKDVNEESLSFSQKKNIKILDISKNEGGSMKMAKTFFGKSLPEFHHSLLKEELPFVEDGSIIDFTEWFNASRVKTEYYYLYYLSLFIYQGILFENFFVEDPSESAFLKEKIIPSFKKAEEIFGVKPLVVRLLLKNHEEAKKWLYYPNSTEKYIKKEYGL